MLRFLIQRSAKVGAPGLVNFITAVAYHICPSLPAIFTQPGASTLADLCSGSVAMSYLISGECGAVGDCDEGALEEQRVPRVQHRHQALRLVRRQNPARVKLNIL